MASIGVIEEESFLTQVERVRSEIRDKFLRVHKLLQDRECELLAKLQKLEDEFIGNGITQQMNELNLSKDALKGALKGNANQDILNQHLANIDAAIVELERKLQTAKDTYKSVRLEWDVELEDRLSLTGDILLNDVTQKQARDYKKIGMPVATFGTHSLSNSSSPGVFTLPSSISIDPSTNYIYICDAKNDRVQVFNKSFEFVFLFGEKMNGPNGIPIEQNKVYVTQSFSCCLNVYSTEGKFLQSVGVKGNDNLHFNRPQGLDVSAEMKRIYIADSGNDRIHCLNLDLSFHSLITNVSKARDVKLTKDTIVVLSSRDCCISLYSHSHQLIREMIPIGKDYQLILPVRIALDTSLNILITDFDSHSVCVYSYRGEFIHKFGGKGEEVGQFIRPTGITVSPDGSIIVCSANPNHCVQVF